MANYSNGHSLDIGPHKKENNETTTMKLQAISSLKALIYK